MRYVQVWARAVTKSCKCDGDDAGRVSSAAEKKKEQDEKTWEARFLALQPGRAVQWSLGGGADREQVREAWEGTHTSPPPPTTTTNEGCNW